MNAIVLALAVCLPQEDGRVPALREHVLPSLARQEGESKWFDKDWKYRRPIAVKNNLDSTPLKAGYPLEIEIDSEFLGLAAKSQEKHADWAVVHRGTRLPALILPGKSKGSVLLCFRTREEIRAQSSDSGYALYYGNPQAAAPTPGRGDIFGFWEDFTRPEALAERFDVDKDLSVTVQDGALLFREVAPGRTENVPARLAFKNFPGMESFELSFDLEIDSPNSPGLAFAVNVDLKEAGSTDPGLGKKIDELIGKLAELEWEVREKATAELIKIGKSALQKLAAATRATDAEVKWRAEHILKEIREKSPSPTIAAGISTGDPAVGPIALAWVIGKNRSKLAWRAGWPLKMRMTVRRFDDGYVTVLWNNRIPQSGSLPGEIQSVSFSLLSGGAGPLGTIRVDNIMVRPYVDDNYRPTHTIQVEESRP